MASRSVSPSARYTRTGVSTACTTSPAANNTPAGPGSPDGSRPHSCATEELTKQCNSLSSTRIVTGMRCPVGAMTHPRIRGFTPGSCCFHGVNSAYMRWRSAVLSSWTSWPTIIAAVEASCCRIDVSGSGLAAGSVARLSTLLAKLERASIATSA